VGAAKKKINDTEAKQRNADRSLKKLKAELRGRERKLKETTTQNSDKRFIKGKNKEAKQKADRSAASKAKLAKKKLEDLEDTRLQARTEHVKPLHINSIPVDGNVVSLQNVSASYDEDDGLVFEDVDVCMHAADRVLLRGANGVGKSTLVKVLLGELAPICGHVVQQGDVVYFPQTALSDLLQLHGDESPRDFLGDSLTETQARRHLGSFGLARDLALRPISTLSAGQRVRLCLAKEHLLHPKPSLLVLDETSENVDRETRDTLVELISAFQAGVLVISHDADFCSRVNFTKTWELTRYGIRETYNET
jgi:ATP-binding cassette subfamily F protein 3